MSGNADFDWSRFDPEAYVSKNYAWIHEEDAQILPILLGVIDTIPDGVEAIDVGIGPNLYPSLAVAQKARSIVGWEFGQQSLDYLHANLISETLRAPWPVFWDEIQRLRPQYRSVSPSDLLRKRLTPCRGSVFDLPSECWDFAMMFFCAESCTTNMDEFHQAYDAFLGCVRPGGTFFAALMENSQGYDVAAERFPAVPITSDEVERCTARRAPRHIVQRIGLSDEPIRPGYSGMLIAHGQIG